MAVAARDDWYALHFPPTSKVYQDQLRSGELLGFSFDAESLSIQNVREGSLASEAEIVVGAKLESFTDDLSPWATASRKIPKEDVLTGRRCDNRWEATPLDSRTASAGCVTSFRGAATQ